MFSILPLITLLLPFTVAAPVDSSTTTTAAVASTTPATTLTCNRLTTAPFSQTITGANLVAVSRTTAEDSSSVETSVILGDSNGVVEACYGDEAEGCKSQLFGFEVCSFLNAYISYGHITYTDASGSTQCVGAASTSALNGSALILEPCQYDADTAVASGQYFLFAYYNSLPYTVLYNGLVDYNSDVYGPTPDIADDASLTLYHTVLYPTDGTWFSFNATSS